MNRSQKIKLLVLLVAAFVITFVVLSVVQPSGEDDFVEANISASTPHYQVSDCKGELISDSGAAQGRAIAYVDSPESGTDAKIIEVPEGKNVLAVSCDVMNTSSVPIDFLDASTATTLVSGKELKTTIYAENKSHLDSNGYPTRSLYGALIYRGETTKLWFVSFVDNTVAESDASLVLDYSIRGVSHQFNIRDNLVIY